MHIPGWQKNGAFHIGIQKNRAFHILFVEKSGANHIPGSAEKGGYSARTSVLCHIKEGTPPLPRPPRQLHLLRSAKRWYMDGTFKVIYLFFYNLCLLKLDIPVFYRISDSRATSNLPVYTSTYNHDQYIYL